MLEVHAEQVLVVPTSLFHRLGYFQGFSADVDRYLHDLLSPGHASYQPRGAMEQDASFKQLIPYCVFRYREPNGHVSVFQYTRGKGQGEGRLHSKRSIGVGGHICVDDRGPGFADPYREGLLRELAEEVAIDTPYRERCVGLINDDQTEVGRVHLGVVHLFDVERPAISPRESDLVDSGFLPLDELRSHRSSFESWSSICLEAQFIAG